MINKPPAQSRDPAWFAGQPTLMSLGTPSTWCLVVPLSEAGLSQALTAGSDDIRDLARQTVAPEPGEGHTLFWRITGSSLTALPAGISRLATIDRLLGRTDAREPLLIRTQQSEDTLTQAFHVPADCLWFEGHFPGEPVLPGIAQLRLAINSAGHLAGRGRQPAAIHQLKFKLPVRPDQIVELALEMTNGGATVLFSLRSAAGVHSSGRLAYGGRP